MSGSDGQDELKDLSGVESGRRKGRCRRRSKTRTPVGVPEGPCPRGRGVDKVEVTEEGRVLGRGGTVGGPELEGFPVTLVPPRRGPGTVGSREGVRCRPLVTVHSTSRRGVGSRKQGSVPRDSAGNKERGRGVCLLRASVRGVAGYVGWADGGSCRGSRAPRGRGGCPGRVRRV